MDKVHYHKLKEFFEAFDINPWKFFSLCEDKVEGWFPNLPERQGKISVVDLVDVLFNNEEPNAAKTLRAFARQIVRWTKDEEFNDSKEVEKIIDELRAWANELEDQNV